MLKKLRSHCTIWGSGHPNNVSVGLLYPLLRHMYVNNYSVDLCSYNGFCDFVKNLPRNCGIPARRIEVIIVDEI